MTPGREGRIAVTMPQLGETVAEGTVLRWLKQVGDAVIDQEPLLEISTDKVDAEVPSPAGGVLVEIVVAEDETVDVGTVLAHVLPGAVATGPRAAEAGSPPATAAEEGAPPPPTGERSSPAATPAAPPKAVAVHADGSGHRPLTVSEPRHRHSPRVRRLAHDAGVDLAALVGTGPGGRVTPDDVARATSPGVPASLPNRGSTSEVARDRAFRTLVAEVDVPSPQWVSSSDATSSPAAATFVAAVASALRGHPAMRGPGMPGSSGDVTVSWSTDSGTVTSLVAQAADLNVGGVAQRLVAGATRAGSGTDAGGSGFAVSFLQDGDVLFELAAPPPGQVATIAFGAPTERVVVVQVDGSRGIAIRRRAHVAVSYDPGAVAREAALHFLRDVIRRTGSHA